MPKNLTKKRAKSSNKVKFNLSSNDIFQSEKSKEELNKEYIKHCIKISHEKKYIKSGEKEKNKMLKRCKKCKDFKNENLILFCIYCQDAYHSYCLNPKIEKIPKNKECIKCPRCLEEEKKLTSNNLRQLKINDLFSKRKNTNSSIKNKNNEDHIKKCFKCNKNIEVNNNNNNNNNINNNICQCEKCKNYFHEKCFYNEKSNKKILCSQCENLISKTIQSTKINDFFKTKKFLGTKRDSEKKKEIEKNINLSIKEDFEIYTTITKEIFTKSNNKNPILKDGKMKLPKILSNYQKEIMKKSLFRALKTKNIIFNDDLIYLDEDCPESMNNSLLEHDIKEIAPYNKETYYKFKEKSRNGEYAPIEIIDDPIQRFIVKAIDDICMNTIICEYTGEVTLLRKKIFDKNDSIMELIRTPSSDTSLVICPEKYGNLARFISGVNNFNVYLKKKQNVNSIRLSIDGSVHILLIAKRNIKKGEILYYDYNAGGYNSYPTQNFV